MKRCESLLICVLAMYSASADSSDARPLPPYASLAVNSATASATATAVDVSAQTALSAVRLRGAWTPQANVADFSSDVVKDMRATSAFVQEQATKAGTPDRWLIALAALGLVILQLRRKHRSLPQRRIAP
jgi:hypothetical protein